MTKTVVEDFARHLLNKSFLLSDSVLNPSSAAAINPERTLRKLWESTDLSANGFADEVAQFYGLKRLNLPQLVAAPALTDRFSPRFLREIAVFPFAAPTGQFKLAMGDPTDEAAARAAEIVLGGPVGIEVASFEDIATILGERLGGDEASSQDPTASIAGSDDDIESLRDLASGAPVVRAVNDLLEKAIELRASDIHIEPFRTGLSVRMRVDGLLRATPTPIDALPQALISRIKILGRPQHRRAAASSRRRRAPESRPDGSRYSRRDHADAAR